MATMLLAAITILLALILVVLVHHIPKEEWVALLDMGLRLCWAGLAVLGPVTLAAITIVWEARHHQEPSFFVQMIPVFFLVLSFAPFAILKRNEYTWTWWKAVRRAVQYTVMAFGFLIFAWWDPIPEGPQFKELTNWPLGDIFAWAVVLLFSYFVVQGIREEWPSCAAPVKEVDTEVSAPPDQELDDVEQGRHAERILVVDNEEEVRSIISSMLVSAGYQCRAVAGGLEALALLQSGEKFELLLTDLLNTPMDGLSLLKSVRERFPDIGVVMATSVLDDAVVLACVRSGAYDYLPKPFDREQLLVAVRRAFEHRRLERRSWH